MTVRVESNTQLTPEQQRVYQLRESLQRNGGTPSGFLEVLAVVIAEETWRHVPSGINQERSFTSFKDFVEAKPPFGLGHQAQDVFTLLQIRHPHEGVPEIRARMEATRTETMRLLAEDGITGYTEELRNRDIDSWASQDRSGGWWLGFFVACQVKKGKDSSLAATRRSFRKSGGLPKISAAEFARRSHTSADRVRRYLNAWNAAHVAGAVSTPSEELYPGHVPVDLPPAEDWTLYYTSRGSRSTDRGELIVAEAESQGVRPTKALEVAENPTALRVAILADPRTAKTAKDALHALAIEERKSDQIELVRRAAQDGYAKTSTGLVVELPAGARAEAARQLALAVSDTSKDTEAVGEAYNAVQELITNAIEADPETRTRERRTKFQKALIASAKSFSSIDPDDLVAVADDDLRDSLTTLRRQINELADLVTRRTSRNDA